MNTAINFFLLHRPITANRIHTTLVAILLLCVSEFTMGCEGEDYSRTIQIANESIQAGIDVGATGDVNYMIRKLQELTARAQQLPPSCQLLLRQFGGSFSAGSSDTNCMGGVCCDSTGCY